VTDSDGLTFQGGHPLGRGVTGMFSLGQRNGRAVTFSFGNAPFSANDEEEIDDSE
jgi:hypothetical protein